MSPIYTSIRHEDEVNKLSEEDLTQLEFGCRPLLTHDSGDVILSLYTNNILTTYLNSGLQTCLTEALFQLCWERD